MADTDALNTHKINICAIGAEQTRWNDNCCTNMHAIQGDNPMLETVKAEKCCTNIDSISKSNNRNKVMVKSRLADKTKYFLSGPSYDSNKKRSTETTHQLYKEFEDVFNGTGCFDCTFSLQLSQTVNHTRHP